MDHDDSDEGTPIELFYKPFYDSTAKSLESTKDRVGLKRASLGTLAWLDRLFADGLAGLGASVACKSGCFYCCHLKVDVLPQDIFPIVDYMRKNFSPEKQEAVIQKARENWKKIEPMTLKEHFAANLPCPLLENGTCSVYSVRPAACRIDHSRSVESCKKSYENPHLPEEELPNDYIPQIRMAQSLAWDGIKAALQAHGYDSNAYDLNGALVEAYTNPKSEKRWGDKKTAFPRNMRAKKAEGEGEPNAS